MEDNKEKLESETNEETAETSQLNEETVEAKTADATEPNVAPDEEIPQSEIKTEVLPGAAAPKKSVASTGGGVSATAKAAAVLGLILAVGVGLLVWKIKVGGHGGGGGELTKLTNEDIALLLKDENPMSLKQLAESPDMKKRIVDSLKQTLAIASQARKEGFAKRPEVKEELEAIRTEIIAQTYDRHKNKDKGPMPPFGYISPDEVTAYYAQAGNEDKFKGFIARKIEEAKKDGRIPADREPSEEELSTAREFYAKSRIYEKEAKDKAAELGAEFNRKVDLQVKLQEANYLARLYSEEVLKKKVEVTDADIQAYLKEHPELDTKKEKKAKADEILAKINAGEDFAKLAKEFSEDPGSKEKGGLYEAVRKGQFVPEFEAAALALEPGQVAPQPVETKYGYHIIKLEKKSTTKDANGVEAPVFDARHILISTMVTDPANPKLPPMPAEDQIRAKLEEEKQKKVLDEIVAKNPVEIPEDFTVPEPSAEKLKEMEDMQKMQMEQFQKMQQGQGDQTDAPPAPPAKTDKKADEKKPAEKKK